MGTLNLLNTQGVLQSGHGPLDFQVRRLTLARRAQRALLFSHAYRAFYEIPFETFEITGPQMVLTMKLTTFAWNVWDGRRPVEV